MNRYIKWAPNWRKNGPRIIVYGEVSVLIRMSTITKDYFLQRERARRRRICNINMKKTSRFNTDINNINAI
jgi:hypothetical protein